MNYSNYLILKVSIAASIYINTALLNYHAIWGRVANLGSILLNGN